MTVENVHEYLICNKRDETRSEDIKSKYAMSDSVYVVSAVGRPAVRTLRSCATRVPTK